MAITRNLQQLVQDAGVTPLVAPEPCLSAPRQINVSTSEVDRNLAWRMLVEQRKTQPGYEDPNKKIFLFKSSKEKEKLQDPRLWEFSQDELDQALSAVIGKQSSSSGLVQAFLERGAKVNHIETASETRTKGFKKTDTVSRKRSNVLQRAATMRKSDTVSLLASSGADQKTLDEGLRAALASNDQFSIEELLRHGADINKCPDALAGTIRSGDLSYVRILLRNPKPILPDTISASLLEAVQQRSEVIISLLAGYGANPNFDNARALKLAVSLCEYRLAVAMAAGPMHLTPSTLQDVFSLTVRMPSQQDMQQFVELLLCCGLAPDTLGLPALLVQAVKSNNVYLAQLLVEYGVSADLNQAEALRSSLSCSKWRMVDIVLNAPITSADACVALNALPRQTPRNERLKIMGALVKYGARGAALGDWLIRAVEDNDPPLLSFLVRSGAPLDSDGHKALKIVITRKDVNNLKVLLEGKIEAKSLALVFPLLYHGYSPSERLLTSTLLLQHGARGVQVDQALIDSVADATTSRDPLLIEELLRHHANVNYDGGKSVHLAVAQADMPILRKLCGSRPSLQTTSTALPIAFERSGKRHSTTLQIIELLSAHGVLQDHAARALRIAVDGGSSNLDIIDRLISVEPKLIDSAFQFAIGLQDSTKKLAIVEALFRIGIPQNTLDAELISETQKAIISNDFKILMLLLDNGASVNANEGKALKLAVGVRSKVLTRTLLSGRRPAIESVITKAFRTLSHDGQPDTSSEAIAIAQELLQRGVEQPAIDSAFRTALSGTKHYDNTEQLVDLLLQFKANVNSADGTCFAFAAEKNDFNIFSKMLTHDPDFNKIIPCLLISKLHEDTLINVLKLCFEHSLSTDTLDGGKHFQEPLLISALRGYPRGEALTTLLLDNGCKANAVSRYVLDPAVGEETVPALIWALAQPQKLISASVTIDTVTASISRSSPTSEMTALHIAAREGRFEVVDVLLSRVADASSRDRWNRSPLFYASTLPVPSTVGLLCKAKALANDSSLHEAARSLNLENVALLIEHSHNPNFKSRLHGGRNALGELCIGVHVTNSIQRTRLRQMIRLLLDAGTNPKSQARNERSSVLLALDNPHCALEVTEALLETEVGDKQALNDEKHLFKDAAGLWYSPLKYVQLVPSFSRDRCREQLIEMLQDKGCKHRFYAEGPEQPDGAEGLPGPIRYLVDRYNEHKLSLRLAKEAHEHTQRLTQLAHIDDLRRKKERDDAYLAYQAAVHAQDLAHGKSKHSFELSRVRETEEIRRDQHTLMHNLLMSQEDDAATRRLQLGNNQAAADRDNERLAMHQRNSMESKMLKEKEDVYDRNVKRQFKVADRMDKSAKLHASLEQGMPAQAPLQIEQYGMLDKS
ncbi:hypothetical protein GQ43DRAFT_379877 [Delitschia confertaspora ATCC 74209]|uniref:Ankyrin repeat protein n=1 Tax=Delitschia confertaspora ATCC 74209 TaxID=1513339 RepID=A0A9P4JEZ4_9PLEO|nr:hypothetical protein GQ43DRAFT_379877 [Delitschia confertaspora ATCC 74209]